VRFAIPEAAALRRQLGGCSAVGGRGCRGLPGAPASAVWYGGLHRQGRSSLFAMWPSATEHLRTSTWASRAPRPAGRHRPDRCHWQDRGGGTYRLDWCRRLARASWRDGRHRRHRIDWRHRIGGRHRIVGRVGRDGIGRRHRIVGRDGNSRPSGRTGSGWRSGLARSRRPSRIGWRHGFAGPAGVTGSARRPR
jgi:hypothetical protein